MYIVQGSIRKVTRVTQTLPTHTTCIYINLHAAQNCGFIATIEIVWRTMYRATDNGVCRQSQMMLVSCLGGGCVLFFFYLLLYSSLCSALTYTEGRNGEIGNARRTKESNAHRIVAEACIALYTTQIAHNHCVYGWLWNNLAQRISLASQWRLG